MRIRYSNASLIHSPSSPCEPHHRVLLAFIPIFIQSMATNKKKGYLGAGGFGSSGIRTSRRCRSCCLLARTASVYRFPSLSMMSFTTFLKCRFTRCPASWCPWFQTSSYPSVMPLPSSSYDYHQYLGRGRAASASGGSSWEHQTSSGYSGLMPVHL